MCCGGGGGGGQRPLEQEEKDLLATQRRVAEQGIEGRTEAMGGFRDYARRGREMGSLANQDRASARSLNDSLLEVNNANRMRDAQMMSMGINPGDARFQRGRDTDNVRAAGAAASAADAARAGVRREGLALESAGYSGLAGFDPSNALNSMGNVIGNAQRTGMMANAAEAQGYGNLAQAGMYGLANADKIGKGVETIKGWLAADGGMVPSYAEGGEVMGMRRYASGGNVYEDAMAGRTPGGPQPMHNAYDMAMGDANEAGGAMMSRRAAEGPMPTQPSVNPDTASKLAKRAVDAVAGSALGYGAMVPGVSMGSEQAALLAQQTGEFGAAGLQATAEAAAGAAGAEGALGAGAAGALGAVSTALPWVGGALLLGQALGLKDGGQAKPGIGRKAVAGRAENPKGGKVSGPGGPKDDMVMARLSPGEFVLPVGAVKKFGLDRLEKMRQAGLEFEKQRNIH